jgi:hypothetical protein
VHGHEQSLVAPGAFGAAAAAFIAAAPGGQRAIVQACYPP